MIILHEYNIFLYKYGNCKSVSTLCCVHLPRQTSSSTNDKKMFSWLFTIYFLLGSLAKYWRTSQLSTWRDYKTLQYILYIKYKKDQYKINIFGTFHSATCNRPFYHKFNLLLFKYGNSSNMVTSKCIYSVLHAYSLSDFIVQAGRTSVPLWMRWARLFHELAACTLSILYIQYLLGGEVYKECLWGLKHTRIVSTPQVVGQSWCSIPVDYIPNTWKREFT